MIFLKNYLKRLIGKKDIEDALKKLDGLINKELMMAVAQIWKRVDRIQTGVEGGNEKLNKVLRKLDEDRVGTFSTSAIHQCHPKPRSYTTSRQGMGGS